MRHSFVALPEVLTPKDLMEYLPLGRDAIYERYYRVILATFKRTVS